MPKFPDREQRREIFMVAALLIGWFNFAHNAGYWPYGATAPSGPPGGGVLDQFTLKDVLFAASTITVGVLYLLGRRQGSVGTTDKNQHEIEGLRQQVQHHSNAASDRDGRLTECREKVLTLESQLAAKPAIVKECWNPPFYPVSEAKGKPRIEYAACGIKDDQNPPKEVTHQVVKMLKETGKVYCDWRYFFGSRDEDDPWPRETKYLTVTMSVTEAEGAKVNLPYEWLQGKVNLSEERKPGATGEANWGVPIPAELDNKSPLSGTMRVKIEQTEPPPPQGKMEDILVGIFSQRHAIAALDITVSNSNASDVTIENVELQIRRRGSVILRATQTEAPRANENELILRAPIKRGIPARGTLRFLLMDRTPLEVVCGDYVLTLTDGIGARCEIIGRHDNG